MNDIEFQKLISQLDRQIESLEANSSHSTEQICSVGVISEGMNIEQLSQNQLILTHTMLHMFANSKNGKDISPRTIEKLHKEVSKKLKNHKTYDWLDTNE